MVLRRLFRLVTHLVVAIAFPLSAIAQDNTETEHDALETSTYGTQDEIAHTIGAWDLDPIATSSTFSGSGVMSRYVSAGVGCCLSGNFQLPSGALLIGWEIEGCDTSSSAYLFGDLLICAVPGGSCPSVGADINTGAAQIPGCATFRANLPTPHTVNNAANTYGVGLQNPGSLTGAVYFRAIRIYYKLQVSPAPTTATFPNDVPTTHPFFRFIEALAAAGITSGCGPGSYCPDAPITRGQMAVFLSAALGLHWAP